MRRLMKKKSEPLPPVLRPPAHPERYLLPIRVIAGLIRLILRPIYRVFIVVQNFRTVLVPIQTFAVEEVERSPGFFIWISVLLATGLFAVYAIAASIVLSMEILEFSLKIPWATMVSSYAWLVVAGSGLCIINGLGAVFGMHRYEMLSKRIAFLSLVSILFGLNYILLHLGRPERVLVYNLISPNFRSAISWMGALYNVYLAVVFIEFWLIVRGDLIREAKKAAGFKKAAYTLLALKKPEGSEETIIPVDSWPGRILYHPKLQRIINDPRLPRITGTLAFITGVAALTMLGSVFAHIESRALWYGPYYPAYFIVSAIFCGYALLLSITIITYWAKGEEMSPELKALVFEMSQVLALVLALGLAMSAYRMVTSLYDPLRQGPVMLLLTGPFSLGFWGFEVIIMSVLPAFILTWAATKKSLGGTLIGAVMVLIGAFVMRYNFLVAGQVYPNIREGLPSYFPTVMEGFVIIGIFGIFLLVYTLGEKFLPLKEETYQHASQ